MKTNSTAIPRTYADAGVDIDKEKGFINILGKWAKKTLENKQTGVNFGHYANTISLGGYKIGISTDGVGSKLLVASHFHCYDTIGIDCVAMNVNDLLCLGLTPIGFVDYLAIDENISKEVINEIAKGLIKGCNQANVPLLGGELATIPDIVTGFDLAGTAIGFTEKNLITGNKLAPGDVIIGIASNGLHSNGFSLARKILLTKEASKNSSKNLKDLKKELLKPTKIYVQEILNLIEEIPIKGIAHITGGGFTKLLRLGKCGFNIDYFPEIPPIFKLIRKKGKISWSEMFKTFNMGIGMIVIVPKGVEQIALDLIRKNNQSWILGKVISEKVVKIKPYNLIYL